MFGAILSVALYAGSLAHLAAADAESPEPVFVSTRCKPDKSESSACLWTSSCPRGGCSDRCILNEGVTSSYFTLLDRAAGEDFYSACPLIAYWMHYVLDITTSASSRRRLQAQDEAVDMGDLWTVDKALMHAIAGSEHRMKAEEAIMSHRRRSVAAESRRRLLDLVSEAPSSESEAPSSEPSSSSFSAGSDLPSNLCITPEDIETAENGMVALARLWRQVFTSDATGEELPADLLNLQYVLTYPNEFQFLIGMLEDPVRLEKYMAGRCMNKAIDTTEAIHYIYWIKPDERDALDFDLNMMQCVDNFGAFDKFFGNFRTLLLECSPPFDQSPDCYSATGFHVISSIECARAYGQTFNISDVTPLANVAGMADAIHTACSSVKTEATCLAAQDPVLQDIADIHTGLPVRNAIEIEAPAPLGPVVSTPTPCFEPPCDAPAPVPDTVTVPETAEEPVEDETARALPPLTTPPAPPAPDQPESENLDANPPAQVERSEAALARSCGVGVAAAAVALLLAGIGGNMA